MTDITDVFDEEYTNIVHEFTPLMYGVEKCTSVSNARYHLFQKIFSNKYKKKFKEHYDLRLEIHPTLLEVLTTEDAQNHFYQLYVDQSNRSMLCEYESRGLGSYLGILWI